MHTSRAISSIIQLLSDIQAKHTFNTHIYYKCILALIFHPMQHNDTICTSWYSVQSVLALNPGLIPVKGHPHLAYESIYFCSFLTFFFFLFSPYAPSLGWVVLRLLGLELLDEQLSTYSGFFPIQGFIWMCKTLM